MIFGIKLHKIFPSVSPLCDKCHTEEATPPFILCPNLTSLWTNIFQVLSEMLYIVMEPDPLLVVLGASVQFSRLNKSQQQLLSHVLIMAKKLILLFCKKAEVSLFKLQPEEVVKLSHLERIRFSLANKVKQYNRIWHSLLQYIDISS